MPRSNERQQTENQKFVEVIQLPLMTPNAFFAGANCDNEQPIYARYNQKMNQQLNQGKRIP